MFAFPQPRRLNVAPASTAGAALGTLAAAATLFVPAVLLESLVMASGVPALLAAAEPPLGATARVLVALLVGLGVGGLAWLVTSSFARRAPAAQLRALLEILASRLHALKRADVHPDAPARPPVLATRDLGTPFLEVRAKKPKRGADDVPLAAAKPVLPPVEQPLPADFDVPLSAFDPSAIPTLAAEPVRAVAPLAKQPAAPPRDQGQRIETFELTPQLRPAPRVLAPDPEPTPTPLATPRTDATIHALLDRLERGVARREATAPPPPRPKKPTIEDTLAELRQLAMRA